MIPIWQMKKLSLTQRVKWLPPCHMVCKWWSRDLNPGHPAPDSMQGGTVPSKFCWRDQNMFGFLCFLNVLILLTTIRVIIMTSSRSEAQVALLTLAKNFTDFIPFYPPSSCVSWGFFSSVLHWGKLRLWGDVSWAWSRSYILAGFEHRLPASRCESWKASERPSVQQPPWTGGQREEGRIRPCQHSGGGVFWCGDAAILGMSVSLWPCHRRPKPFTLVLLEEVWG